MSPSQGLDDGGPGGLGGFGDGVLEYSPPDLMGIYFQYTRRESGCFFLSVFSSFAKRRGGGVLRSPYFDAGVCLVPFVNAGVFDTSNLMVGAGVSSFLLSTAIYMVSSGQIYPLNSCSPPLTR